MHDISSFSRGRALCDGIISKGLLNRAESRKLSDRPETQLEAFLFVVPLKYRLAEPNTYFVLLDYRGYTGAQVCRSPRLYWSASLSITEAILERKFVDHRGYIWYVRLSICGAIPGPIYFSNSQTPGLYRSISVSISRVIPWLYRTTSLLITEALPGHK